MVRAKILLMNDIKDSFGVCRSDKVSSVGEENITDFAKKQAGYAFFCTPGHKGELNALDLTELDGGKIFPSDSVEKAEKFVARQYGVEKVKFSVNGASQAIKCAIITADGDIVAPVFSHRALFEGARLIKRKVFTFDTGEKNGLPVVPTAEDYRKEFGVNPSAKVAFVTSPDYFGRTAKVEEIRKLCVEMGKILIVDCAHGAHFAFSDIFPSGGEKYAHFSVLSAHKTLRALTQSAFGVCNDARFSNAYDDAFTLLGTTSPSYLLLGSLYDAVKFEVENGDKYALLNDGVCKLRRAVKCHDGDDPMRVVVNCGAYGKSGEEVFSALTKKKIMPETYYGNYCIFIITLSDSVEKITALTKALIEVLEG